MVSLNRKMILSSEYPLDTFGPRHGRYGIPGVSIEQCK